MLTQLDRISRRGRTTAGRRLQPSGSVVDGG
jgi:hypothetical protein